MQGALTIAGGRVAGEVMAQNFDDIGVAQAINPDDECHQAILLQKGGGGARE